MNTYYVSYFTTLEARFCDMPTLLISSAHVAARAGIIHTEIQSEFSVCAPACDKRELAVAPATLDTCS